MNSKAAKETSSVELRVAARYQQARVVPIDKSRLRALSKDLEEVIIKKTQGVQGSLGKRVLVPAHLVEVRSVSGAPRNIYVRVESLETKSPYYVLYGGLSTDLYAWPTVVVFINGSLPAEQLFKGAQSGMVAFQLYPVLIHEFTHAADIGGTSSQGKSVGELNNDPEALSRYYNSPVEVRAYIQEIVDQLELKARYYHKMVSRFGPGRSLQMFLNMSDTWKDVSPHWTDRNRKTAIKAVVQRLEELERSSPSP